MCGRYSLLEESDDPVIRQIIRQVGRSVKYGEICPTNQAPTLAGESLRAQAACWGIRPPRRQRRRHQRTGGNSGRKTDVQK